MGLKQIWNSQKAKMEAVDDFAMQFMDSQADAQERRLVNYMKVAGLTMLFFIFYTAFKQYWLPCLILICTLHIHIIVNYRFKNLAGVPQWKKTQTTTPPSSETG